MDIFTTPLLTARDAARHLRMPESTLDVWIAQSKSSDVPLVHTVPARRGWPRVPFVGVIEAYVLRSLRELDLPMAAIREAAEMVRIEFDDPYALASRRIATDGLDIFVDLVDGLVSTSRQRPIREVVNRYLQYVEWGDEGRPARLQLQQYPDAATVVIDPRFGWGRPILDESKTPVAAIVGLWRAGDSMDVVAREFDLSRDVVEEICRAATAA
jgi:uncharacterized protein (DUF433 family)